MGRIEAAASRANLNFKDFLITDNTCKAQDQDPKELQAKYAGKKLLIGEQALQQQLTAVRGYAVDAVLSEEKELSSDVGKAVDQLEKLAANDVRALENEFVELKQDVVGLERKLGLVK